MHWPRIIRKNKWHLHTLRKLPRRQRRVFKSESAAESYAQVLRPVLSTGSTVRANCSRRRFEVEGRPVRRDSRGRLSLIAALGGRLLSMVVGLLGGTRFAAGGLAVVAHRLPVVVATCVRMDIRVVTVFPVPSAPPANSGLGPDPAFPRRSRQQAPPPQHSRRRSRSSGPARGRQRQ